MEQEVTQRHLGVVALVHRVLDDAGICHWLAGGWGGDVVVGHVTRAHRDIEFAVWNEDWPRVHALLTSEGFSTPEAEFPDEVRKLMIGPTEFEFWMLARDDSGNVVVGGRWTDWAFPDGSFDAPQATLRGVTCPVPSAEGLLDSKVRFPDHPSGRPLRDKDRADIELLLHLVTTTQTVHDEPNLSH